MLRRLLSGMALLVAAAMLASCGGSGAAGPAPGSASSTSPAVTMRVHHPPTLAFAAPFSVMATQPPPAGVEKITYDTWTSADMLRALLSSNSTDVAAAPSYVGANLYNRGAKVRLAGVTVWGILHLFGPEGVPAEWGSLRGQEVHVARKNDMPDLVFRYLLKANGLDPEKDVKIVYYGDATEIVTALVSGKAKFAVLPEHVATVAEAKAKDSGQPARRLMDLQSQWAKATGQSSARIPQAGVVVAGDLPERNPAVVGAFIRDLETAIKKVNSHDPAANKVVAERTKVPAPLVDKAIDRLSLRYVPAQEARPELERFYQELAKLNPGIIGGKLPDDGFYLRDLR